jgi:hypothetical protein
MKQEEKGKSKNKVENSIQRERLYTLMNTENTTNELDPNKLLLFLKTKERSERISFKYYSEFLNILNTIIFLYGCAGVIRECQYDIIMYVTLDASFIICSLVYYFIIKHKKIKKSVSNKIFILAFFGIFVSRSFSYFIGEDKLSNFVKLSYIGKD